MRLKQNLFNSPVRRTALLVLLAALFSLLLVPGVPAVNTGLDPSWQFALTKAHVERMIWGKDVIFTFGPFGYLFFGSLIKENFFEMQIALYLLRFAWLFLSLQFILKLEKLPLQLFGTFALILFPTLLSSQGIGSIEIDFILIILLITIDIADITSEKEIPGTRKNKLYVYGVASAFMLMVKLNFGLLSMACPLIAIIISSFFKWRSSGYPIDSVLKSFAVLNWFLFGFLAGCIAFLNASINDPFLAILVALIPAIFLFLFSFFSRKDSSHRNPSHNNSITNRLKSYFHSNLQFSKFQFPNVQSPIFVFLIVLCSVISIIAFQSNVRNFIIGSLQITSGYSQSMTVIGPVGELQAGCFLLQIIASLALVALFVNPESAAVVIPVCLFSLMSFKHGFIRHDGHILAFATSAPIYIFFLSCFTFKRFNRSLLIVWKFLCYFLFALAITFLIALGVPNSSFTQYYKLNLQNTFLLFSPERIAVQAQYLFNPKVAEEKILGQEVITLAKSKLSPVSLAANLRNKSVDILPWSASIVAANDLRNWQPAPIFQAYAAYTRWLDEKNLASYQANPRSRIVYSFRSIDGRHPYFDQPRTTLFLICNYQPTSRSQRQEETVEDLGEIEILRPIQTPICSIDAAQPVGQLTEIAWEKPIDLNNVRATYQNEVGNILLAKIDVQYSLFGKIYSKLFRTPPIELRARYNPNLEVRYRLVPDTAKAGIIVGSLPLNLKSSMRDFMGYESEDKVQEIYFASSHLSVFKPTISVQFERIRKQAALPHDFDAQQYLELHEDVKAAGVDPAEHFRTRGFFENRAYK
ncbi:hypothetical protein [Leptolyngbya sp. ST-U4]|uniref:hypothetical protein n=1 Tax=Leptolyngbya sp. ST-U4 TaxID=2933912 RepID=UPI0019ADCE3F|nr:hypothetical protein [Cyanobacteria bacterium FACHB-502]